ncbi:hypothetical protein [Deinococcus altitudinis]|uniref:hypothetical protein n=1 Tax=Deinococcus altitudinis TaxID=468914 RepID=UPI0038920014
MRTFTRYVVGVCLTGALFAALPSALAASQPAVQAASDPVRVTSLNNGRFRLRQGRVGTVIDLNSSVNGCTGQLYDGGTGEKYNVGVDVRVLDEVNRAGSWYLLMQVDTGPNCNVQGMCGAGTNTDLIWLKLSPGLKVVAKQAEMVENCQTGAALTDLNGRGASDDDDVVKLGLRGGVLNLTSVSQDYGNNTQARVTLRYDRRTPERGLLRTKTQTPLN